MRCALVATSNERDEPVAGHPLYTVRGPNGEIYANAAEAAAALGVSRNTVYGHIFRNGHLDNLGKKTQGGFKASRAKPLTVCGRTWKSRAELSRWLGFGSDYVKTLFAQDRHASAKLTELVMTKLLAEDAENRRLEQLRIKAELTRQKRQSKGDDE